MDRDLRILAVDDNEGCRKLYALWLADHRVETATNGREALERLDGGVDVVLLDRDMPGPSGTEVARAIDDSDHDPHVAMVSSLAPDVDLAEFPVDAYVQKPMTEEDVRGIVDQYRAQQTYREALDEFFSLTAKVAAIEARKSGAELDDSQEYARLKERLAEKRAEVDEALSTARADWAAAFRTCTGDIGDASRGMDPTNGVG